MATLITHNDFDGVTCAVLFKAVWPDGKVYFEDYKTINDRLWQVVRDNPKDTEIYITDICPENNPELVNLLEGMDHLLLFDHHKTALPFDEYSFAHVKTGVCGAALFYEFLVFHYPKIMLSFEKLVWYANDYDLWKHESPLSKQINKLLYLYGRDRFIQRFLDSPDPKCWMPGEELLLELEQERQDRYIQEVIDTTPKIYFDEFGRYHKIAYAEQYTSELGHSMLKKHPEIDFVIIINLRNWTASLRSRPGGVDVSEIAKRKGGGGHLAAAGYTLPENFIAEL